MTATAPQRAPGGGHPTAPRPAARAFVISDAHGHPELIERALDDGGFVPGRDGFIYAGDFLDRGPDPAGCLELLERYATEVLVGNHELAVLLDFDMCGTEPESWRFRPVLIERVLGAAPDGAASDGAAPQGSGAPPTHAPHGRPASRDTWKVATCCQGVIVTHAGVSARYEGGPDWDCGSDPVRLVAHLNEEFLTSVRRELETGDWDEDGIFGRSGPLWYRPTWSPLLPLEGVRQVSGHTPPQPELEADGFWMVDPCVWRSLDCPRCFRYAVIQDGEVTVVERELQRAVA